jgi:hypothetical protein
MSLMNWKKCEREFVRKVEVDLERVDSIKKNCFIEIKSSKRN